MKLTFLGTGTSHGVPVIACDCKVCKSKNKKDKRTRSAAYLQIQDKNNTNKYILIDIGPDFREQALRENIRQIDAVLLTHAHADHLHGIDDLRNFSCIMSNKPDNPQSKKYERPPIPIFTNQFTVNDVKSRFSYLFSEKADGGGHAKITMNSVEHKFEFSNIQITPIPMMHGTLQTFGWLLTEKNKNNSLENKSIAYLTDCNCISDEAIALIKNNCGNLVHLIIDGLRIKEHSTHFNFLQALEIAGRISAEHIWLTHLTHNSSHAQTIKYLKAHREDFSTLKTVKTILPAYDGLVIEC